VSANKGHQMAKIADAAQRTRFLAWVNELEYGVLGVPRPDRTILLHVPADVAFELVGRKDERAYLRGRDRDIHEADRGHLRAAEDAYLSLLATDPTERWCRIDCVADGRLLGIDEVAERVWQAVRDLID
jgi:dTMP kinase